VASIRARAAAAYAAALAGSLALFAGTLWLARGTAGDRELQRYVLEEAEVVERLLVRAGGPGLALTEVRDPIVGPLVVDRVRLLLDVLPNIVLVTTDDQTLADLSKMPKTSRFLGERGVSFTNALSPHPLCCPARAEGGGRARRRGCPVARRRGWRRAAPAPEP